MPRISSGSNPSVAKRMTPPTRSASQMFFCVMSNRGDDAIRTVSPSPNVTWPRYQFHMLSSPAAGTRVGLGLPVDPDVVMT